MSDPGSTANEEVALPSTRVPKLTVEGALRFSEAMRPGEKISTKSKSAAVMLSKQFNAIADDDETTKDWQMAFYADL